MKYDVMIGALEDTIAALGKIAEELSNVMPKESKKAEEKPKHSFEEVRGVLAKLSADGYTTEVKAILRKFECRKLSDVKEDDYEKVLQEAKKICDR
ncbi:MAG: hypothetical protein K2H89_01495 [Oscillospiraceae bacterium]|nr:hypothetical protein [Oscillospiraceae bacterium]